MLYFKIFFYVVKQRTWMLKEKKIMFRMHDANDPHLIYNLDISSRCTEEGKRRVSGRNETI